MDDTEVESSMEALSQALAERPTSTDNDTKDDAQSDGTQQIWVLSGGNGPGQQASFQSGKNAWQKLRRPGDLQVYHAVLVPVSYQIAESTNGIVCMYPVICANGFTWVCYFLFVLAPTTKSLHRLTE